MSINKFLQPGAAGGAIQGALYGAGNGDTLGVGSTLNQSTWTQEASGFTNINKISGETDFAAILTSDGDLYCTGNGGTSLNTAVYGDTTTRTTFVYVTGDILDVAACEKHIFIIKNDGTLWAAGEDSNGKLGIGGLGNQTSFVQEANGFTDWEKCFSGRLHNSAAIRNGGDLYFCGDNSYYQYGIGSPASSNTFVYSTGNVDKVAFGLRASLILTTDGKIYGASSSQTNGDLGVGDTTSHTSWTQEASGFTWLDVGMANGWPSAGVGIRDDGSVWSWGDGGASSTNTNGFGDNVDRTSPEELLPSSSGDFIKCARGAFHTLMLTSDGTVWFVGRSSQGQDGDGDTTDPANDPPRKVVEGSDVIDVHCSIYSSHYIEAE